ncbi:N-acetylglucosamine-6-sulfatase-like [Toxorhynchites rutilus septentrionalis]|uniref:N-acetylglucosamine-6-sulfatase-like n=1 Tax=Toxorhynchites rutilus septentrionalis TaxID=329112 RepID=UPI0024788DF6|nr:N-acetylglucosamine-6-sulfatase-like [Toxorhynchites rutilus septentrionalis]
MFVISKMEPSIRTFLMFYILGYVYGKQIAPNIIVILTDDQDVTLKGLAPMVKTQQFIANEGATFTNAFTSSPICCPSRSSILSGQYTHNTRTHNNSYSGGCYGDYWRSTVEPQNFPVKLQQAGYKTFYAGKYLNQYMSKVIPPGWNEWYGLYGNSIYYNYTLNENGRSVSYSEEYLTDLLRNKTLDFISNAETSEPFFAMVAPPAPHAPYTAAQRHQHMFPEIYAPRTKNFNIPCNSLEKHWLLTMPPSPLPNNILESIDDIYRKRWQSLMAVDEMVEAIAMLLERKNILQNTFVIYTSDNGYHLGQFSQPYDKRQPYETDIRVPFLIRGPNIAPKSLISSPVALFDIAPTIFDLAGLEIPSRMDGESIMPKLLQTSIKERQILIEYWGEGNVNTYNSECPWQKKDKLYLCTLDAVCHCQDSWNNTYNCVRHLAEDVDFIYCEFMDNEHFAEAYDLTNDLYQIQNVAFEILPSARAKYSLALTNLTQCMGESCRQIY